MQYYVFKEIFHIVRLFWLWPRLWIRKCIWIQKRDCFHWEVLKQMGEIICTLPLWIINRNIHLWGQHHYACLKGIRNVNKRNLFLYVDNISFWSFKDFNHRRFRLSVTILFFIVWRSLKGSIPSEHYSFWKQSMLMKISLTTLFWQYVEEQNFRNKGILTSSIVLVLPKA